MHFREWHRPTSTGRLINRVLPASRAHLFRPEAPPARDAVTVPGREMWVLHPRGEPLPAAVDPAAVQVMLLDGSWAEAARMTRSVTSWGRLVRLPMSGPSRYWLRSQTHDGHYATVEALLFLLANLGLTDAEAHLRRQFELHVYAGLRSRGQKARAEEYLATSPVRAAFPDLLRELEGKGGPAEESAGAGLGV